MATHIIASSLPPKKSVDFSRYRMVRPAWITDSIAAGKLLPWAQYRVLDEGPRQNVLKFDASKGLTQASPQIKQGYREQTDNSFYTSQFKTPSGVSQSWNQAVENRDTPVRPYIATDLDSPSVQTLPERKIGELTRANAEPMLMEGQFGTDLSAQPKVPQDTEGYSTRKPEPLENATSEEHNAWLLSDPRTRKSSTANPDFLKQFYSESRLHHLSTWKANLKSKMQQLAAEKGLSAKQVRRKPVVRRYVMHVDFDSFFCTVSLKSNPEYVGKPAAVAHSTGSGSEIASCNYPARKFGVKNGMWMKRALELCSDLKVLPYDFPAYEKASRLFYETILEIGGIVQSVSVDEALVDVTSIVLTAAGSQGIGVDDGSILTEQDKVDEIASALRAKIKEKTGCEVSVGIGGNILQAKVALRKAKPAGQYQIKPEEVLGMIGELQVENLPGVAYSIGGKLEDAGVKCVKDLREISKERLTSILGPKTAEKLRDYSRGIDKVEVGEEPPRKSVSAEVNWGVRFISQPEAEEFVYNLCKELERRLLNEHVKGKQLTMKIMRRALDAPLDPPKHLGHGKCDTFNKSSTFGVATHSYEVIGKEAVSILRSFKISPGDLRGLGVQMTKLEPIKTNHSASEGSQRKLTFNAFKESTPARKQFIAEAIDEGGSPKKIATPYTGGIEQYDPIAEDPLTPRKQKVHPAMALAIAGQADAKARTPLNVSGTQFIIPSNADLATLAALPNDIRNRLTRMSAVPMEKGLASKSWSGSPNLDTIPSQVDAEVFNALPEEMKAEVLAAYGRNSAQADPQQSPRKEQPINPNKQTTPTKRSGRRGAIGKEQRQRDTQAGLLQTSFRGRRPTSEPPQEEPIEELDPDFLAELPEDVRKEVIADHRRRRLAQRSGLDAPTRRQHNVEADSVLPGGQRRINFPPPPPKVTFATSTTTSTKQMKDTLDAWHSSTRLQGPHRRDVEVFEKYLADVVLDERDLEKVVKLVKWLDLLVEHDGVEGNGKRIWRETMLSIKDSVQKAVVQRGLAPLNI